jgi:hypothetical protein
VPYRVAALLVVTLLAGSRVCAQQAPNLAQYLMSDRTAEIALARSAAPRHISDSATVMVLARSGFVEVARGTNGFTCLVLHSFDKPIGDPGFWDPAIRAPHCLNPAAVHTVLRDILKRTVWIMAGVAPADVVARTKRAYASHELLKPAPGAMAYMLSPSQHLADTNPHWVPHVMFYFDTAIPSASFGVGGDPATLIDGSAGDPDASYTTLLIPVRRWSDGKPAMPDGGH